MLRLPQYHYDPRPDYLDDGIFSVAAFAVVFLDYPFLNYHDSDWHVFLDYDWLISLDFR